MLPLPLERPWLVGGLCILLGYVRAWFGGLPRHDDLDFPRLTCARWQARQLKQRLCGPCKVHLLGLRRDGTPTEKQEAAPLALKEVAQEGAKR